MTQYHQIPKFSLARTSFSTRVLVSLFLLTVLGGLAVALLQYHDRVGFDVRSAVEWIHGNEEDMDAQEIKSPKTYRELLAITHDHAFSLPVLLFVLLHLVGLSRVPERGKTVLYIVAFLSLVGSLAGPWLIAYGGSGWTLLLSACGTTLSLTIAAASLLSLWELWCPAARRSPGR